MKLNAVGVTSRDIKKTIDFYTILGFSFETDAQTQSHVEPLTSEGSARLMIDSIDIATQVYGHKPKPANTAAFALEYDKSEEIDVICNKVQASGFTVMKEPWHAPWGQYYAVLKDPDGYIVDLYCNL